MRKSPESALPPAAWSPHEPALCACVEAYMAAPFSVEETLKFISRVDAVGRAAPARSRPSCAGCEDCDYVISHDATSGYSVCSGACQPNVSVQRRSDNGPIILEGGLRYESVLGSSDREREDFIT